MASEILHVLVYIVGWILFVWLQAHNSALSKTNSLDTGWKGYRVWLTAHAAELGVRGFFSAIGYGFIVHTISSTVGHVGFQITSTAISGVAGFSANTLCYQFMGLFPALRAEVAEIAPPPNSQVVPVVKISDGATPGVGNYPGTNSQTSQTSNPNPQSPTEGH